MRPLMIFAAGFGTRMGTLTRDRPKPMIPVAGKPLIDHALDVARGAGAEPIVLNLHYLGEQIGRHLADQPVKFAWERDRILETGGGLRAALPLLGASPVATLNPDIVWTGANPLNQLWAAWAPDRMDSLLLVAPAKAVNVAKPDFRRDAAGRLERARATMARDDGDLVYLGAQITRTDSLAAIPEPVFSLNRLWDIQIAAGRCFGLLHQGGWCDVGHPSGIAAAEVLLGASR
jgi:N-acetyl-alpha-D-muramate 1-phosphate uridylyltransferase